MKITYQPFLPRVAEQRNHYIAALATGAAAGASLCVLCSAGALFPLIGVWATAGALSALALSFFAKKQRRIPNLHHIDSRRLQGYEQKLISQALMVAPGDSLLDVYSLSRWAKLVEEFIQKEGFAGSTQTEQWEYAQKRIQHFLEFLLHKKLEKDPQWNGWAFFANPLYIPVNPTFNTVISLNKQEIVENLTKFFQIVIDQVLKEPID